MSTRVVTGKVRLVYPYLFQPRPNDEGKEKYSVQIIIPKSDTKTVKAIKDAMIEAAKTRFGNDVNLRDVYMVLRDGDEEGKGEAYDRAYFANCNNQSKPGVVDENLQKVIDPDKVKSGDWGRVSLNAYAYTYGKNTKGVSLGVNNVQWLEEGEPVGAWTRAEDDFADAWGGGDEEKDLWD